jgi:hypothetical protein
VDLLGDYEIMAHLDLGNRLAIYGWKKDTEDFRLLLSKVWHKKGYKNKYKNVEQLLYHPSLGSIPFVSDVRKESKINIPEQEVLQTLNNHRKNKPELY